MTMFFYRCKFNNEVVEGYINAQNITDASKKLTAKEYIVLEIKQKIDYSAPAGLKIENTPFNVKEKKDFYASLAKQYKSGVAFLEIFNNVIATGSTQNVRGLAFKISKKLQKGDSIADVFSYFSSYIGKTEAALIAAGDASGTLIEVLEKISEQVKEEESIIANLKSKITYPAILIGLLFFAVQIALFFILPVFNQIIQGVDVEIKDVAIKALIKIAICTSALGLGIIFASANKKLKKTFINGFCKIKQIKEIIENYCFSNFFATLALAQEAGLAPDEAVKLAKETIFDKSIDYKLDDVQNMLKNGCKVSTAFAVSSVFSDFVLSQIDSGEISGNLSSAYDEISQEYKNNFKQKIDFVIKAIEPALIGFIGIIVLVVLAKILLKYYEAIFSIF